MERGFESLGRNECKQMIGKFNIADFDGVFFDMDGVLFDSMPLHEKSWTEAFKSKNIFIKPEDAYLNEGRTGESTINTIFLREYKRKATQSEIDEIYGCKSNIMKTLGVAKPLPLMPETVNFLINNHKQCFVVTGSRQQAQLSLLCDIFGFNKLNIICGNDYTKGKPDPEPYLKALQRSCLQKERCVVIENAPLGIISAKAAQLFTIAVNTGKLTCQHLVSAGADIVIDSTIELYKLLAR